MDKLQLVQAWVWMYSGGDIQRHNVWFNPRTITLISQAIEEGLMAPKDALARGCTLVYGVYPGGGVLIVDEPMDVFMGRLPAEGIVLFE